MSLLQVGVPLGVFIGYVMAAGIVGHYDGVGEKKYFLVQLQTSFFQKIEIAFDQKWEVPFFIQSFLLVPSLFFFALTPNSYIEVRDDDDYPEDPNEVLEESSLKQKLNDNPEESSLNAVENEESLGGRSSVDQIQVNRQTNLFVKNQSYFDLMQTLFSSKLYVLTILTISLLYFVVTGIQFWGSDYLINVIHGDEQQVFLSFAAVSITGPTLGVVTGGITLQQVGGYEKPKALLFVFVFGGLATIAAVFVPFLDSLSLVVAGLWIVLFFGGAMVPGLTGVMLTSVSPEYRTFANSNAQTLQNLIGFLPAPTMYGVLSQYQGPRAGMFLLMYTPLLAMVFSGLAYRHKQNLQQADIRKQMMMNSFVAAIDADVQKSYQKQKKYIVNDNQISQINRFEESRDDDVIADRQQSIIYNNAKLQEAENQTQRQNQSEQSEKDSKEDSAGKTDNENSNSGVDGSQVQVRGESMFYQKQGTDRQSSQEHKVVIIEQLDDVDQLYDRAFTIKQKSDKSKTMDLKAKQDPDGVQYSDITYDNFDSVMIENQSNRKRANSDHKQQLQGSKQASGEGQSRRKYTFKNNRTQQSFSQMTMPLFGSIAPHLDF